MSGPLTTAQLCMFGCGPLELAALRALDRELSGGGVTPARIAELLAAVAAARAGEAEPLPVWEQMSEVDRGAALMHLHKVDYEGRSYAVENYPARYFDDLRLVALAPVQACAHAAQFERLAEGLLEHEHEHLYNLALAAENDRRAWCR